MSVCFVLALLLAQQVSELCLEKTNLAVYTDISMLEMAVGVACKYFPLRATYASVCTCNRKNPQSHEFSVIPAGLKRERKEGKNFKQS